MLDMLCAAISLVSECSPLLTLCVCTSPPLCVTVPCKIVRSGRLAHPSLYHSYGDVNDLTAAPGGGAHHQPSPCHIGPRSAPVGAPQPFDPVRLPVGIPGRP